MYEISLVLGKNRSMESLSEILRIVHVLADAPARPRGHYSMGSQSHISGADFCFEVIEVTPSQSSRNLGAHAPCGRLRICPTFCWHHGHNAGLMASESLTPCVSLLFGEVYGCDISVASGTVARVALRPDCASVTFCICAACAVRSCVSKPLLSIHWV